MAIKRYFKFLACFLVFLTVTSASGIYANINTGTTDENNVIYVSISGNDTNDGLTLNTSKKSIQNAINNADNGTKIIISPGTYKENLKISKNVTLTSNQPKKTIINGQQNDTCITIYRGCNVTINGLTITNGRAIPIGEGVNPHSYGGGVWAEGDLTLTNSIITKNTAKYCEGGGISNRGGEVAVNYCNIRYNTAKWGGGGMYNGREKDSFCSVNRCNIAYNKGLNGGGLYNGEGMRVANSRIISNRAEEGGGVFNCDHYMIMTNTYIRSNGAIVGGGISNISQLEYSSKLYLYNCRIMGNVGLQAGGIHNRGSDVNVYADKKTIIMFNFPYLTNGEWVEPMPKNAPH